MFQRVVAPLDGSDLSERALAYAAAIAGKFGARLTLLRAFDGPERSARLLAMTSGDPVGVVDPQTVTVVTDAVKEEEAEVRAHLAEHGRQLQARGLAVDTIVVDGPPVEAILQEAQREPDTLVVMSTHGRGGLGRLVFGSVAQEVTQHCHAPVLLIRAGGAVISKSGHDTGADVTVGAEVMGTDGRLGEVHRVIVDANLNRVTELAVKHGFVFSHERVVPMGHVQRIDGGVLYTDLDRRAFEALDQFVEERYRVPGEEYRGPAGLDRGQYLLNMVAAEGPMAGQSTLPPAASPSPRAQVGPDDSQVSALAVGMQVVDADGEKVGEVGDLSVAPDSGAPTRITVRRGMLVKHDTEIPVAWVQEVSDRGVVLRVGKREIEALG